MSSALESLEPRPLWSHFRALSAIPRPSKREQRAAAWVVDVGRRHGFEGRRDAAGNVVLSVPPSSGRETAPPLILQGHLDMVCEKDPRVQHDFLTDPIRPRVEGDWVRASGTTLGADNGIGVSACLAAATDPAVAHGPLELLFTVDEETGLTGAANLDPSLLRGRTLLNLDSEEDGTIFVGCAGGLDSILSLELGTEEPPRSCSPNRLEVSGLRGGHSGVDIHENRGNAVRILARLLAAEIEAGVPFGLGPARGGSVSNAIPRQAEAIVLLEAGERDRFDRVLHDAGGEIRTEVAGTGDDLRIGLGPAAGVFRPLAAADRNRLVRLLLCLPNGVLAMSREIPGLVETSNNVAILEVSPGAARIVTSSRSSVESSLRHVALSIRAAGELAGARVRTSDGYPAWRPDLASPILALVRDVVRSVWGREPVVTAVHAGLECGLLGRKIPGLDMVSFGPKIVGAHSPEERVQIASVERFWRALVEVLDRFSRAAA